MAGCCGHSAEPSGSIKVGGISWLVEWLLGSQEGRYSMELVVCGIPQQDISGKATHMIWKLCSKESWNVKLIRWLHVADTSAVFFWRYSPPVLLVNGVFHNHRHDLAIDMEIRNLIQQVSVSTICCLNCKAFGNRANSCYCFLSCSLCESSLGIPP